MLALEIVFHLSNRPICIFKTIFILKNIYFYTSDKYILYYSNYLYFCFSLQCLKQFLCLYSCTLTFEKSFGYGEKVQISVQPVYKVAENVSSKKNSSLIDKKLTQTVYLDTNRGGGSNKNRSESLAFLGLSAITYRHDASLKKKDTKHNKKSTKNFVIQTNNKSVSKQF